MKKIILMASAACFLVSCDSPKDANTTNAITTDSNGVITQTTTTTRIYAPTDGDVMMKDGKTMVWKDGAWIATTGNTTMTNGMVISSDGMVRQNTRSIKLLEGEAVTKTGYFFDRAGAAIDNAWDATKRGVNKAADATGDALQDAGRAIGKGARKIGDKTDSIVKDIKN